MRILNKLTILHDKTKRNIHKPSRAGVYYRLMVLDQNIARIGKPYCPKRTDVMPEAVLAAYLARRVYYGDSYEFHTDLDRELEEEFTKGLWDILCIELFGTTYPELSIIPRTYKDLFEIFDNKDKYLSFSLYDTIQVAVCHSVLMGSRYCTSLKDFDLHCSLPGEPGWLAMQHGASLVDGRKGSPMRLLQAGIGMYIYDSVGASEPYKYFWIEKAEAVIKKAIALHEERYSTLIRRALGNEIGDRVTIPKNKFSIRKMG